LHDETVDPATIAHAIRQTIAVLDGTGAEVGGEPSRVNLMVTNGHTIVALHLAENMAYRVFSGKQDADAIVGEDEKLRLRTPERDRMRFALVASDFSGPAGPRWNAVPDRAMVVLTRDEDPKIVA
jgi:glutamine amidotransferase